jgi:hypothetical protein
MRPSMPCTESAEDFLPSWQIVYASPDHIARGRVPRLLDHIAGRSVAFVAVTQSDRRRVIAYRLQQLTTLVAITEQA